MPRNFQDVHLRLLESALELFVANGYDGTTAAEVAARAGVTERTFFRHFADKRDILFDGEEMLQSAMIEALSKIESHLAPLPALERVFESVAPIFEANRYLAEIRHGVIAETPALREREASKRAGLIELLAWSLRRRGVEQRRAVLAVQLGSAAFSHALECWIADGTIGLQQRIRDAFTELRELSGE